MKRSIALLTLWMTVSARSVAAAEPQGEPVAPVSPDAETVPEKAAEVAGAAAGKVGEETKEAALEFRDDMRRIPSRIWQDIQALPDAKNAIALAAGGALAGIARSTVDDRVSRLFIESRRLHDFSLDLASSLTMSLPVVYGLKKAFHTERPNGDPDGFPSGHAAASAVFGALLNRHYGPYAGIAGAGLAALVAFHRVDARQHDVSDVIFGAAIGYVAGRTAGSVEEELPVVRARHEPLDSPTGARGLALAWSF